MTEEEVQEWHAKQVAKRAKTVPYSHCLTCRQPKPTDDFQNRCVSCRAIVRQKSIQRKYGLNEDDVAKMRADQQDRCAICGNKDYNLNIDHDHATGRVRELLCRLCNNGLGQFKDDPDLLRAATTYLERHMDSTLVSERRSEKKEVH